MSDIFNEIKEAVLQATPGEDTRNYYRNQGMAIERERIIKLLQADRHESHAIDDIFDGIVFQTLSRSEFKQALIALIKGETNGL